MTKRLFLAACGATALAVLTLASCDSFLGKLTGDDDDDEDTYQLTGTLTKTGVQGRYAYLKLVQQGLNGDAAAIYWTRSTAFDVSGNARYAITGIRKGTYTGYAFIDANVNAAGDGTSQPDDGDLTVDQGRDFTFGEDQVGDIPDNAWIAFDDGLYTMSGTVTKSGIANGTTAYFKLVHQGDSASAPALYSGSATYAGEGTPFSVPDIAAGTYSAYAFFDVDGNNADPDNPMPDSGDWVAENTSITIEGDNTNNNIGEADWTQYDLRTLTGTITHSGDVGGKFAYVKLVSLGGNPEAEALYFCKSDGFVVQTDPVYAATYTISGIEEGTYTLWAFVDINGTTGGSTTPEDGTAYPDTGDYAPTSGIETIVTVGTVQNFQTSGWVLIE
jgi:hypothetical protein